MVPKVLANAKMFEVQAACFCRWCQKGPAKTFLAGPVRMRWGFGCHRSATGRPRQVSGRLLGSSTSQSARFPW